MIKLISILSLFLITACSSDYKQGEIIIQDKWSCVKDGVAPGLGMNGKMSVVFVCEVTKCFEYKIEASGKWYITDTILSKTLVDDKNCIN